MTIKNTKTKLCLLAGAFGVLVLAEPAMLQAQSSDPAMAAQMEIRFQQMEKEIRRLTGQIEEQNFEIRRLKNELSKVTGDLDVRVRDLEGGNGGASAVAPPPYNQSGSSSYTSQSSFDDEEEEVDEKPSGSFQYTPPKETQTLGTMNKSPDTGEVRPSVGAAQAYEYAYSFIKARDFSRAENEFGKFMGEYPNDPLISNAKYWYGETFYVRGNYEKSARIFAEGYQQFPKGPKAASNLLKLGMALSGMGKSDDACIAYKQLKSEYSGSAVSLLKRADTEMAKINCR
ncbi:MAG: tol-pal system protein YbgF [Alphaproteobacteria bacterium]